MAPSDRGAAAPKAWWMATDYRGHRHSFKVISNRFLLKHDA